MDSAIRSLTELRLGSVDKSVGSTASISDVAADPKAHLQSEGMHKKILFVRPEFTLKTVERLYSHLQQMHSHIIFLCPF